jgi:hypothetical protein
MFKIGLHDPFRYLKHKLWPKEGLEVKLAIWLLTTKNQELSWFPYVQVACHILLKRSWRGLQLCFNPHLNRRFAHNVMGPQSCRSLNLGTKWHLGACPMARHRKYYKGEGGVFPQVRAMVTFVSLCLLVTRMCTKSALIMHQLTCCLVCAYLCE